MEDGVGVDDGSAGSDGRNDEPGAGGGPKRRHVAAVAFVVGLGALTFLVHGYHLLTEDLPLFAVTFGVLVPMAVSATLIGCGVWLARAGFGARTQLSVSISSVSSPGLKPAPRRSDSARPTLL